MELKRLNTIQDFKDIENPTAKSKYYKIKWTVDNPLILKSRGGEVIIAEKWAINSINELIFSNKNDYFNLAMYEGSDQPQSWIADAYKIVDGGKGQ